MVFLHGLVVQVLAVHHEEHLVDEVQLRGQPRRFETGQGLARTRGVPDEATTLKVTPTLCLVRAVDLPEKPLGGRNLVRAHYQQRIAGIKHRVVQQHIEQGVLLQERGREVL